MPTSTSTCGSRSNVTVRETTCHSGCPASATCYAIPALVAITAIVAMVMRRWRVAAFILAAIGVEAATYRVATWVIHRQRPDVPRLDDLPADASYFSGHTAASVAVYCGIALVITRASAAAGSRSRLDDRDRDPAAGRARADVPRHAPPDRCGRRAPGRHRRAAGRVRGRACRRRARRLAGRRTPNDASRGYRPRGQEHRGRPAAASPYAGTHGVDDPLWVEVPKSQQGAQAGQAAARRGRRPVLRLGRRRHGAALRSTRWPAPTPTIAIVPAGTANLLATNLGIPKDIEGAVTTGLRGRRRRSTSLG